MLCVLRRPFRSAARERGEEVVVIDDHHDRRLLVSELWILSSDPRDSLAVGPVTKHPQDHISYLGRDLRLVRREWSAGQLTHLHCASPGPFDDGSQIRVEAKRRGHRDDRTGRPR